MSGASAHHWFAPRAPARRDDRAAVRLEALLMHGSRMPRVVVENH